MKRTSGWVAAGLASVALLATVWWLVRRGPVGGDVAPPPPFVLSVTLTEVERGDLVPRAQLIGNVRAARRARVAFEVPGTVRALFAEEAQAVAQGAMLAQLVNADKELELAEAEAALTLTRREHELLQAGERAEEKRRLLAVLEVARAEEELTRSEVERSAKLLESRVISESEQDRRVTEHLAAQKRRAAAEELYALALAGTRAENLAIARARVDAAGARVASARNELEKTALLAPWNGRVIERFVSPGDYVASGSAVYELLDLEHLEVHVDVPGRLAGRLGEETRALLRLPGGAVLGTSVDALVPAADERARSFRAIVRLGAEDGDLGALKPGMFVDVELVLQPFVDALLVPSDAVLVREGGALVVRAVPAGAAGAGLQAELVPVRVLAQEGGRSVLDARGAPLAAGDPLVLIGADNAFPGAPLAPRAAAAVEPAAGGGTR